MSSYDEVKYKILLQELECTEILLSNTKIDTDYFRLEAEYYNSKSIQNTKTIKGKNVISYVQYGTSKFCDETISKHSVLRLNELNNGFIETPQKYCHLLTELEFESLKLNKGDVLIIRTNGNPHLVGRAAVVMENTNFAFASYLYRIITNDMINSETLVAFLNSKYGRIEIDKNSMKGNQTNFSPAKFRDLNIPLFDKTFQNRIKNIYQAAYENRMQSKNLYNEAEKILERALGLENFTPSTQNISIKSLKDSFGSSGRLDAEYYQPKYEECFALLNKFSTTSISQEYKIFKNSGTNYSNDINAVGVIKTKQIKNQGVNINGVESYFDYATCNENKSTFLENGDVIFASMGVGSLGKVSLFEYNGDRKFVTDSTLRIYRAKENAKICPEVLCLFLQSKIAQEIIYRYVVGSTGIINIYDNDMEKIPLPIIDIETQKKIAGQVQKFFALRRESARLLETAKAKVEYAIENGE